MYCIYWIKEARKRTKKGLTSRCTIQCTFIWSRNNLKKSDIIGTQLMKQLENDNIELEESGLISWESPLEEEEFISNLNSFFTITPSNSTISFFLSLTKQLSPENLILRLLSIINLETLIKVLVICSNTY